MTTRRLEDDKYFTTQFSGWCRENEKLDSRKAGIIISNLDYVIMNHITDKFIILEEKCQLQSIKFPQSKILMRLHNCCKSDKDYMGFFLVQFEHQGPTDGSIFITDIETDKKVEVSEEQLTQFLLDFVMPDISDWW